MEAEKARETLGKVVPFEPVSLTRKMPQSSVSRVFRVANYEPNIEIQK